MERLVKPLNDFAFKKAMGEKGDEPQLLSFLNAVLARTGKNGLQSVEIIDNKDITPDLPGEKTGRLDVLAKLADGSRVNIEVQVKNEYNMEKRSPFYWAAYYTHGIQSGENYKKLAPVITINIVDYNIFPLDDFQTSFHLWEDRHKDFMLTDVCEMHFLDMVLFRKFMKTKDFTIENPIHRWLSYLNATTPAEIIEEVVKMDDGIAMFHGKLEVVNRDPALWRTYLNYEKAAHDWTSSIEGAREETAREVARKAMAKGWPIQDISEITGLDTRTIQQIAHE